MGRKKILFINNTIFYEDDNSLYLNKETGNFFLSFKNEENQVSLFQLSQLKTINDSFANFNISEHEFKIFEIKRRKSKAIPFLKAFFAIQKAILKNDFVYIFYPGPICQVIAMLCNIYSVPYGLYIRGEQGIDDRISKYLIKNAFTVFTISPLFTDKVQKLNPCVHTIRPMIGFTEKDIVVNRNYIFKKEIRLLYVGRIVFDKGLFELVDAVNDLVVCGYKITLTIVGSGSDQKKLIDQVEFYGIGDHVKFLGMISEKKDLKQIYMQNDIFVLPTYHEGFPRVLYEAMLMRMPIITTFVGTISYLMRNNYNCLEIFPRDANGIVESIKKLIDNPNFAKKLGENGINTILDYLSDKKLSHAEHLNRIIKKIG